MITSNDSECDVCVCSKMNWPNIKVFGNLSHRSIFFEVLFVPTNWYFFFELILNEIISSNRFDLIPVITYFFYSKSERIAMNLCKNRDHSSMFDESICGNKF